MAIITLMTDFGQESFFPAAMKGAILRICPDATIVDVTHQVPEHDITAGGYALYATYRAFPKGTIHVGVVDPGVGGERAIVAVQLQGYTFIVPDNGLMSFILKSQTPDRVFTVSNRKLFAGKVAPTFHGRDIFSPVAAHLAAGTPIEEVGPERKALERLDISAAREVEGGVVGEIISVDRFGNLVTNIRADMLPDEGAEHPEIILRVGGHRIEGIRNTYADVGLGQLVAYVGSTDLLEIGRNRGSARDVLGAGVGHTIKVSFGD